MHITDGAHLAIIIYGVDETDSSLVGVPDRVGVDSACASSPATDGTPSVIRKNPGVVTKLSEKVQATNGGQFLDFSLYLALGITVLQVVQNG